MTDRLLANARLYAVTPAAKAGWAALFAWLARETGLPLVPHDHPVPMPMAGLWARPDLGCAFMCGWPFSRLDRKPHLLGASVPRFPRYGGKPMYVSDLVVRRDSPAERLEDTFGGTVGWTIEDSHSGFNAPRHHLLAYRTPERPNLFARSVGGLINPLGSLTAVAERRVDVAPVDGFCHDLFRAGGHPVTKAVRTIASTAPSPIPPLIASAEVEPAAAGTLRAALLRAEQATELADVLEATGVARFVRVTPETYEATRAREHAADAAGYAMPA